MKVSCPFYEQKICLSCDWITQPYEEQLEKKAQLAQSILGVTPTTIHASSVQSFRDKIKLAVGGSYEQPLLGMMNNNLKVTDLTGCLVQNHELNALVPQLKEFIQLARLEPYDITKKSGELKFLILFISPHTQEKYLRFVLRSQEAVTRIQKHLDFLSAFGVISVNLQPLDAAILEGEKELILTRKNFIRHQLNGLDFELHPKSFVQTNSHLAEKLYSSAQSWIKELPIKKILDLFCGMGPFALHLYQAGLEVVGFEINAWSIESAQSSNQLQNKKVQFITQDTHQLTTLPSCDLMVVNPPRRGLGESLNLILKSKPKYLLYSSCHIQSLGQDWMKLQADYKISRVEIFDFFPHTEHFETLVLMENI
jgi:23S rRNA (uracil747-C5)-methyltransferase